MLRNTLEIDGGKKIVAEKRVAANPTMHMAVVPSRYLNSSLEDIVILVLPSTRYQVPLRRFDPEPPRLHTLQYTGRPGDAAKSSDLFPLRMS